MEAGTVLDLYVASYSTSLVYIFAFWFYYSCLDILCSSQFCFYCILHFCHLCYVHCHAADIQTCCALVVCTQAQCEYRRRNRTDYGRRWNINSSHLDHSICWSHSCPYFHLPAVWSMAPTNFRSSWRCPSLSKWCPPAGIHCARCSDFIWADFYKRPKIYTYHK